MSYVAKGATKYRDLHTFSSQKSVWRPKIQVLVKHKIKFLAGTTELKINLDILEKGAQQYSID